MFFVAPKYFLITGKDGSQFSGLGTISERFARTLWIGFVIGLRTPENRLAAKVAKTNATITGIRNKQATIAANASIKYSPIFLPPKPFYFVGTIKIVLCANAVVKFN